jgi:hypothetical protein
MDRLPAAGHLYSGSRQPCVLVRQLAVCQCVYRWADSPPHGGFLTSWHHKPPHLGDSTDIILSRRRGVNGISVLRCYILQAAFREENTFRRGEVTSHLFCTRKGSERSCPSRPVARDGGPSPTRASAATAPRPQGRAVCSTGGPACPGNGPAPGAPPVPGRTG